MILSLYRVLADLTVLQGVAHIRHQCLYLALKQPQLFQAGKRAADAAFFQPHRYVLTRQIVLHGRRNVAIRVGNHYTVHTKRLVLLTGNILFRAAFRLHCHYTAGSVHIQYPGRHTRIGIAAVGTYIK